MDIECPKCHKVIGIKENKEFIVCECGQRLMPSNNEVFEQLLQICKDYELKLEEDKVVQIRKMADGIVSMILGREALEVDIEIKKKKLKELIENISPEKIHLYELIYEPRFTRLWKQFRQEI